MPTSRLLLTCLLLATIAGAQGEADAQETSPNVRLLAAARAGDMASVTRALADGATPNARSRVGETALVIALKSDRTDLARQMLDAGTDVNLAAVSGVTPLMAAAHGGHVEIVRMLLAKGADVDAIDRLQKNAITYAAGQGRTEIVQILLRAGVDPNAPYAHSLTALMWAAGYGHTETVRSLRRPDSSTRECEPRRLDRARFPPRATSATTSRREAPTGGTTSRRGEGRSRSSAPSCSRGARRCTRP